MTDSLSQLLGVENVLWDLSIYYQDINDPAIQADMDALTALVADFVETYRGKVAQLSAAELLEALKVQEGIFDKLTSLSMFANLTYATDTNNPAYGALAQRFTEYASKTQQQLLFFTLEWNQADDETVQPLIDDPVLEKYQHYLSAERRYKPYSLSEAEEQILVEKSVTGRSAWVRFFTQLTGAMRLDYEGEKRTLTEVLSKLHHPDRDTRRKANDSISAALKENAMELTYIFNILAADKASDDRLRNYPSWISSRNLSNKAQDSVVETLIQSVTANYDIVEQHYTLKRGLLGLDSLAEYDRYAPLPVKGSDKLYTWNEAKEIVLNAFAAFSPKFAEIAQRFFDENWIHAPVLPGKRGGAFCAPGSPASHPFVLVNYTGQARDIMTLAHELGHGIHSYLANEAQGAINSDYPLTTAEMASTFGEMLVFNNLIEKETDPQARLAMLAEKMEDSIATVFRQISMNRFEDGLHTARRTEGELTAERISAIWAETQQAMFGESVQLSEDYAIWWSYIPHFLHTPGYVYAYAFGELLVMALYKLYQEQGQSFIEPFIGVLSAGGSDYPENILAKVGVDLNDPDFWNKGLSIFRERLEQEIAVAKEIYPDLSV